LVFEHGSVHHLQPIAMIYREAFPESIQLFFAGKDPGRLLRLLTNAFAFLYLTGARIMIARRSDNNQILGYCVYSSINSGQRRTSLLIKNMGRILRLAGKCLRDLRFIEIGKLAANSILMWVHTRANQKLPRKHGRIMSIAVRPAAQGQGIGKELLTRVLSELPKENVLLNVRPDNTPALSLYQNAGFTECGMTKDLQGKWVMMIRRA